MDAYGSHIGVVAEHSTSIQGFVGQSVVLDRLAGSRGLIILGLILEGALLLIARETVEARTLFVADRGTSVGRFLREAHCGPTYVPRSAVPPWTPPPKDLRGGKCPLSEMQGSIRGASDSKCLDS